MRFIFLILLTTMAISCSRQTANNYLNSSDWKIVKIGGLDASTKETSINFNLDDHRISGNAGCNNFFGSFNIKQNSIDFSQVGTTRKMCQDMTTEDLLLSNITKVKYYTLQNEILHLQSEDKSTIIVLQKVDKQTKLD